MLFAAPDCLFCRRLCFISTFLPGMLLLYLFDISDIMNSLDLEMTPKEYREDLTNVISQMMFVSGETAEPSAETTTIIEEIVHTQVVEMVRNLHQIPRLLGC